MQEQRILIGRELKYRNVWLIRLRYLAVAGMVAATAFAQLFALALPAAPVLVLAAAILTYNGALHIVVHKVRFRNWYDSGHALAVLQILADLLALSALVVVTGGPHTPVVFFYVFHGILAAIVLPRRTAYLVATAAVALLLGIAGLEQSGWFAPVRAFWAARPPVDGLLPAPADVRATAAVLLTAAATLYTAVYMTVSLSRELRAREEQHRLAGEKLREQDRLKSEYVRLIAHDLKDPLAAIQATLRVVLDGYTGALSERQRQLVGRAETRADDLARLVTAMLDLSNIRDHAAVDRSTWCFAEMTQAVVEQLRPLADGRHIALALELPAGPLPVYANRNILEQVPLNLVGNALKYTPDGGRVVVRVERAGDSVDLSVGDTGIGVPPESLARIFDEFYRAPNAKRTTKDGTGLGLALVRRIVEAHGGTVSAESPWTPAPDAAPTGTRMLVKLSWEQLAPPAADARPGRGAVTGERPASASPSKAAPPPAAPA